MNTPLMQVVLLKQVVGQTLVTMTLLKNQSFFFASAGFPYWQSETQFYIG